LRLLFADLTLNIVTNGAFEATSHTADSATAGYFYDTFAYEICFYGIYFYQDNLGVKKISMSFAR
jgi:hypothetical protein